MGVPEAQKALEQAQAAYNNNKDKALKKALKAAKAALAAEEAKQQQEAPKSSKKRKNEESPAAVTLTPAEKPKKHKRTKGEKDAAKELDKLTTAIANAKTAYKADKTKENKQKLKAAKAALKAFQPPSAAVAPPTPVSAPAAPPSTPSDVLAGLKSNKSQEPTAEEKKKGPLYEDPCNRVFVANLSFDIDDEGIKDFFKDCGAITKIAWIEDKETKRFKGCGVLDFETLEAAVKAVAKHDQLLLGRKIVAQYSRAQALSDKQPRGTGVPPVDEKQAKFLAAPLAPKPAGCVTCFVGNLSFLIEEDDVRQLAEDCGEITSIRWVYHKDSGDFKGCGFVDFAHTDAVDKFVAKKGTILKGRPIRIDYSESRSRN